VLERLAKLNFLSDDEKKTFGVANLEKMYINVRPALEII
jgi:hypothetical protein